MLFRSPDTDGYTIDTPPPYPSGRPWHIGAAAHYAQRVDVAAYEVFKTGHDGSWKPGFKILGLAEDGVGWALDEHNAGLVSALMESKVEQVRKGILSGKIKIHDYMSDNKCPVQ